MAELEPQDLTPKGWHTVNSVRDAEQWPDSINLTDDALQDLLDTAQVQCETYAPDVLGPVPVNYRQAQLLQARNLWQAVKKDNGDQIGADGQAVRVYPLDWVVQGILRPKTGVKTFG